MSVEELPEIRAARKAWVGGGSALPLVELLASMGARIEAATYARMALARPDCKDAEALRAVLESLSSPPPGWNESVEAFARNPSPAAWDALMRFIPLDLLYLRMRDLVQRLRDLGMDGDSIFRYAGQSALFPDLIKLVEDGQVSARVLEERAARAGGARTAYFGLAAEAAFLSGDMLGTVRLLRLSVAYENPDCGAFPHIEFIRSRATEEQARMLDKAGIPQAD